MNNSFNIPLFSRSIITPQGEIYLTGGLLKPNYLQTTFFYEQSLNEFKRKSDMQVPRADHSLVYMGGYIYAVGSFVHNKCNQSCERYDVQQNIWMSIASLKFGRAGVALCGFDNQFIYAFGG